MMRIMIVETEAGGDFTGDTMIGLVVAGMEAVTVNVQTVAMGTSIGSTTTRKVMSNMETVTRGNRNMFTG